MLFVVKDSRQANGSSFIRCGIYNKPTLIMLKYNTEAIYFFGFGT